MENIQVGKPYVEGRTAWPEGLEYCYDRGGHRLGIFLRTPSKEEIEAVWLGAARFGLLVDGDVIFLCYRFYADAGGLWLSGQCSYSWHMVGEEERALPDLHLPRDKWGALSIILVNAENGIVEAQRVMSLSGRFSVALARAIRDQARRSFDQAAYHDQVARLTGAYTSSQIWRMCSITCKIEKRDKERGPLFELGRIVGTPGAQEALERAGEHPAKYLGRHVGGDWGELGHYDLTELTAEEWERGASVTGAEDKLNKWGVHKGGRIVSVYILADGTKIWIITEGDRSATRILLPGEL